jgi:hypothetical protein
VDEPESDIVPFLKILRRAGDKIRAYLTPKDDPSTLVQSGLGKLTGQGSGILVMAIVGGAIIPIAQGALADRIGIHLAFILPAVCYLYIVYYGLRGSRHA